MGATISYDHEEPLESYLEKYRPSKVDSKQASWIYVSRSNSRNDDQYIEEKADMKGVKEEWNRIQESAEKLTQKTLKDLAVKFNLKVGKWMIFAPNTEIDGLWSTIAKAVVAGKLGITAKVSPRKSGNPTHLICVYTKDFTDQNDVQRVEKAIRELDIHMKMHYKPDIYTHLNIYSKNKYGIPASIYTSDSKAKSDNPRVKQGEMKRRNDGQSSKEYGSLEPFVKQQRKEI